MKPKMPSSFVGTSILTIETVSIGAAISNNNVQMQQCLQLQFQLWLPCNSHRAQFVKMEEKHTDKKDNVNSNHDVALDLTHATHMRLWLEILQNNNASNNDGKFCKIQQSTTGNINESDALLPLKKRIFAKLHPLLFHHC